MYNLNFSEPHNEVYSTGYSPVPQVLQPTMMIFPPNLFPKRAALTPACFSGQKPEYHPWNLSTHRLLAPINRQDWFYLTNALKYTHISIPFSSAGHCCLPSTGFPHPVFPSFSLKQKWLFKTPMWSGHSSAKLFISSPLFLAQNP